MAEAFDVVIAGAGPAGLSAGIVLAEHDLRVLVADARRLPADKPCGEGIMPNGVLHLRELGIDRHLPADAVRPFSGIRYRTVAGGREAAASFAEGPGWGMRRIDLAAAFLARAREVPSLEIRERASVRPLARSSTAVELEVGGKPITTRLLIGADGLASRVRRWAGLERRTPRRAAKRWGVRRHFAISPWSDEVEVHFARGAEAYVTPCGGGRVNVAFLWDRDRAGRIGKGAALVESMLMRFPLLARQLDGAEPTDEPRATGPLRRVARAPVSDGVLLIGDAAGYLDAITGEGISLATGQALALERAIVHRLRRGWEVPSARDLHRYAEAHRAIVQPYYRLTKMVLRLARHPRLAERVIGALAREPDVLQHLLSANMGLASPYWFGLGPTARFLRSLLRPAPGRTSTPRPSQATRAVSMSS